MSRDARLSRLLGPYAGLVRDRYAAVRRPVVSSSPTDLFRYRGRPVEYAREVLGAKTWEFQRYYLDCLDQHRRIAIRSQRGTGKSHAHALATSYWLDTRVGAVLTLTQVDRATLQLWSYIRDTRGGAVIQLPGRTTLKRIDIEARRWAAGFSLRNPEMARSFHAGAVVPDDPDDPYITVEDLEEIQARMVERGEGAVELLLIIDEAPAIDKEVFLRLRGTINDALTTTVLSGNPLMDPHEDHYYAKAFRAGSGFHRIKLAAKKRKDAVGSDKVFESGFGPDRAYGAPIWLVRPDEVEDLIRELGEDDPLVLSDVYGQFSKAAGTRQVVPAGLLEHCSKLGPRVRWGRHIGVDPARYGGDETVAVLSVDGVVRGCLAWKGADTPEGLMTTAEIVVRLMYEWGEPAEDEDDPKAVTTQTGKRIPIRGKNVHIDVGGVGGGAVDRLRQMGYRVDGCDFGGGPRGGRRELVGQTQFVNLRDELHYIARRALQEAVVSIPDEDRFRKIWDQAQWAEFEWKAHAGAVRFKVEKKEEIKDRFGRSPDWFDAYLLTLARKPGIKVR